MIEGREGLCLGLIGGLGVGATIHYYQELAKAHEARGYVPNLVILHADVKRVLAYAAAQDTTQMAEYLSHLLYRLSAAGAEIAAIPAITPHMCAAELTRLSPLPLVDLVEEVRREILVRGFRKVALFGTRFSIETEMFGRLKGIDVVKPNPAEIDFVHKTYLEIVSSGSGTNEQYEGLCQLADTLRGREGVDAIVFAGTELSLIFNEANTDFPHVNGAALHLHAIMNRLVPEFVRRNKAS